MLNNLSPVLRQPLVLPGVALILLVIVASIGAPLLCARDPTEMRVEDRLAPPSSRLPFGGDELGRDMWSRVIYGGRLSLAVSMVTVLIALPAGTALGLVSGYFRGYLDALSMRAMDMVLAFPPLLLALFLSAMLGPSLRNAMIAMGIVYTPGFARVARASALSLRNALFVEAAISVGASPGRVLLKHVLPNTIPVLIVQSTLSMAWAILTEAALSFMGLGAQPPAPSWGGMLSMARSYMEVAPWTAIFPGIAIVLSVLGFSLLGDALRDVLDPRLSRGMSS